MDLRAGENLVKDKIIARISADIIHVLKEMTSITFT